jgi:RNA polymerase sigma-70 factor (TIGR02943 family)
VTGSPTGREGFAFLHGDGTRSPPSRGCVGDETGAGELVAGLTGRGGHARVWRMSTEKQPDPEQWVDRYGDLLYRYALLRVRRPEVAADLVQETFVEAWQARASFAGRSSEATWLIGILRHKVIDHLRRARREASGTELPLADAGERFFTRRGFWRTDPGRWPGDPGSALEREEFWDVFRACLAGLPDALADAFLLRELDGRDTGEICQLLAITPTNLWARLHRARLQLRACLARRWFGGGE